MELIYRVGIDCLIVGCFRRKIILRLIKMSFELGAEMRMDACREETDPSDCKFEHWGTWPDPFSVQDAFS